MCAAVVGVGKCAEALLSGCVEEVQAVFFTAYG